MQILSHNYQQLILLFLIAQVFGISFAIFAYKDLYIITFLIAFYLIFFCINYKRNSLTENIKIYFLNIIFIGFLCGVFATTFKIYKNQTAPLNGEYLIKGRVLEIKPRQGEMVLTVEVDFINTFSSKPINKILVSTDAKITNNFMIGTNIIFSAKLKNFEYNWFLNQNRNNLQYLINGISGSGKMLNLYLIEEKTLGFLGFIYKIRKKIYDTLVNNIGSNGHFVAALILGETGKIDSNVINAARSTGVSHILCVSGLHLSIVCFLFFKVSRIFLNCFDYIAYRYDIKKISAIIAIIASVLFLLLSGSQIASTRACLMTTLAVIGILLDKGSLSIRIIFFVGFCMLFFYPEYLYHPSFQLSYMAVIGIISTEKFGFTIKKLIQYIKNFNQSMHYKLLINNINIHNNQDEIKEYNNIFIRAFDYCMTNIYVTSLVSLVTLPIVLYHFYFFANYSVLANLIIVPITSFILMPLSIIAILAIPLGISKFILPILSYFVDITIYIMQYIAKLPYSIWYVGYIPYYLMSIAILSYLLFLIFQSRIKFIFLIIFFISIVNIFSIQRPKAIITHNMIIINDKELKIYTNKYNTVLFNKITNWLGVKKFQYMGSIPNYLEIQDKIVINENNSCNINTSKQIINLHNNIKCKINDIPYKKIVEKEIILYE